LEIFFAEAKDSFSCNYKTFRILRRSSNGNPPSNIGKYLYYDYKDLVPYRRIIDFHDTERVSKILPGFSFKEGWTRLIINTTSIINESGFSQIEKKFY
jgi:hypothetical protein